MLDERSGSVGFKMMLQLQHWETIQQRTGPQIRPSPTFRASMCHLQMNRRCSVNIESWLINILPLKPFQNLSCLLLWTASLNLNRYHKVQWFYESLAISNSWQLRTIHGHNIRQLDWFRKKWQWATWKPTGDSLVCWAKWSDLLKFFSHN